MDMAEGISAILEAAPIPGDAMASGLASRLFWVTRSTLSRAVKDGELRSCRDLREPTKARRKLPEAQLAKLCNRRP